MRLQDDYGGQGEAERRPHVRYVGWFVHMGLLRGNQGPENVFTGGTVSTRYLRIIGIDSSVLLDLPVFEIPKRRSHERTIGSCVLISERIPTDQISGQDALVHGNGLGGRDDNFGRRRLDHYPSGSELGLRRLLLPFVESFRLYMFATSPVNRFLAVVFPGNAKISRGDRQQRANVERSDANVFGKQRATTKGVYHEAS